MPLTSLSVFPFFQQSQIINPAKIAARLSILMHGLNAEFVQPAVVAAKTVAGSSSFALNFNFELAQCAMNVSKVVKVL